MFFHCYICVERFNIINDAVNHLKKQHAIKEYKAQIQCLVLGSSGRCPNTYDTFSGLKRHLVICSTKHSRENVNYFIIHFKIRTQNINVKFQIPDIALVQHQVTGGSKNENNIVKKNVRNEAVLPEIAEVFAIHKNTIRKI